jgi:hypothetical protein
METPAVVDEWDTSALTESAASLMGMIQATEQAVGVAPAISDTVLVTEQALKQEAMASGGMKLMIDPNTNEAWIEDETGSEVSRFSIGTGDITGTRYGKKYYSPVGTWQIVNEVPYGDVEGSYGPLWMGLSAPKSAGGSGYGLHGPHRAADKADGGGFVNGGHVSHGCIRFTEDDILKVGHLLDSGADVTILPYAGTRKVSVKGNASTRSTTITPQASSRSMVTLEK